MTRALLTFFEARQLRQPPVPRPEGVVFSLTQGNTTTVDASVVEELSKYTWHLTTHGYVARKFMQDGKQKQEYLHRRLMGNPEGMFVDHINLDKLDNRACNLRVCTQLENNRNTAKKTGKYKGVHFSKSVKKWTAQITANGIKKTLGFFETEEEGARAYDEAARVAHGRFARTNFSCDDCCDGPNCICTIARAVTPLPYPAPAQAVAR